MELPRFRGQCSLLLPRVSFCFSPNQPQTDQFLRQLVNVIPTSLFANPGKPNEDHARRLVNLVDDPVSLADCAQTPEPDKFIAEGCALFFGFLC